METRGERRKQKSVKGKNKETGGENKGGEEETYREETREHGRK